MKNLKEIIDSIKASDDEEAINILRKAIDDEDMQGMSIVDDPDESNEDDEADQWLQEQSTKKDTKPKQRGGKWKAPTDHSEDKAKEVKELMDQGYSEREAHRFAGTHKEHSSLQNAMRSGINPSMMSDKMIDQIKPLAKEWLDNADRNEKINADKNKNPMKYASGQMMQAHEDATNNFSKDYHNFLNEMKDKHTTAKDKISELESSDPEHEDLGKLKEEVKGYSGRGRHEAVKQWKKDWKAKNPDHEEGLSSAAEKQKVLGETRESAKANLQEKMDHIMRGGVSMPGVSSTIAAQHLGQESRGDDMAPSANTEDISSTFAAKNPKLVAMLNQEHMTEHKDRLQRVDSHANAGGVIRRKKSEEPK